MNEKELESMRFPIGEFHYSQPISEQEVTAWIKEIASFPERLKSLVDDLNVNELNWKYRPGGWSIKQLVHHCADSHSNSLIRIKLALTEEAPTIMPYHEDRWAELPDGTQDRIQDSMEMLKGLHAKMAFTMASLTTEQRKRVYVHPEHGRRFTLTECIGIYAWHSNHHLAHVRLALEHKGAWN